jgi:hypothetical protein
VDVLPKTGWIEAPEHSFSSRLHQGFLGQELLDELEMEIRECPLIVWMLLPSGQPGLTSFSISQSINSGI